MLNCMQELMFNIRFYNSGDVGFYIRSKFMKNDYILLSTDLRYIVDLFNDDKIKRDECYKDLNSEYCAIISIKYIAFENSGSMLPSIIIYPTNIDHIVDLIRNYWQYCDIDNLEVKTIRYNNYIAKYKDGKLINIYNYIGGD